MVITIPSVLVTLMLVTSSVVRCQTNEELQEQVTSLKDELAHMTGTMKHLARQTMLQQLSTEERVRTDGNSGIKIVRGNNKGPANYYSAAHMRNAYIAIHDHSNLKDTMGMGEIVVVLNGIEFRTRHNDYKLVMPSKTSNKYHETEPIPFPEPPEAVTKLTDVGDQIDEMRKWFKAFKDQDYSERDYRPHFKPVLCYLEGTWTLDQALEEPFSSDRHHLDASSWFDLQEKIRFTTYTGSKDRLENYAYLPTTIMSVNETTGQPNYAQWNYRILCHPISQDIPTSYLKQEEDLSFRYPRKDTLEQVLNSRGARFRLYEHKNPRFTKYGLIDEVMAEIPGKDNTPDDLTEDSFGEELYKMDSNEPLNVGYYHRWFKFAQPGAMGLTTVARGFNDDNLWVAKTSQHRVAPMQMQHCPKKGEPCDSYSTRYSYAIPLEVVYLSPLLSWNPFNLYQHPRKGTKATDGKRTGDENKPLNGTDRNNHYLTPIHFFSGDIDTTDPADTVKSSNYVLDQDGEVRQTTASGTKIILQDIAGVGQVRLRYPIAPLHGEGTSVWKELNALRDDFFEYRLNGGGGGGGGGGGVGNNDNDSDGTNEEDSLPEIIDFETSHTNKPTDHFHTFTLSRETYLRAKKSQNVLITVTTSEAAGHTHELRIRYHIKRGFEYTLCDDVKWCWDKHPRKLYEIIDN